MRAWSSPASLLWLFGHLFLAFVGFVCVSWPKPTEWFGEALAFGVGAALIATGFAGLTLYLYVRRTESLQSTIEIFAAAGLSHVFPGRSTTIRDEYDRRLRKASEVDIIGFGLSSLREDYLDQFVAWSQRATVRVIVLDPTFPTVKYSYAVQRDREERNPNDKIRKDVEAFIDSVGQLEHLDRKRFQVKKMTALPAINIFRIDDEIFWGPYLMGGQSRNAPTFIVRRGGFLYGMFRDHFERLWTDEALSKDALL